MSHPFLTKEVAAFNPSERRIAAMRGDLGSDGEPSDFVMFMARCDLIVDKITGLGVYDFADAPWRDLHDDLGDVATVGDIVETLGDYDETFAQMAALRFEPA